jgi:hypothetical protein
MLWLHTKTPVVFQENNQKLAPFLNSVPAQDTSRSICQYLLSLAVTPHFRKLQGFRGPQGQNPHNTLHYTKSAMPLQEDIAVFLLLAVCL